MEKYHSFVKKKLGNSARDRAIVEALESLEDGILDKEKRDANVSLLSERLAAKEAVQRNQLENKSSE